MAPYPFLYPILAEHLNTPDEWEHLVKGNFLSLCAEICTGIEKCAIDQTQLRDFQQFIYAHKSGLYLLNGLAAPSYIEDIMRQFFLETDLSLPDEFENLSEKSQHYKTTKAIEKTFGANALTYPSKISNPDSKKNPIASCGNFLSRREGIL